MVHFVLLTMKDGVPWYDPQGKVLPGVATVGREL